LDTPCRNSWLAITRSGAWPVFRTLKSARVWRLPGSLRCASFRSMFTGNLTRRVLLSVWLPLIALSYFGTLTIAAWFSPLTYDWRRNAISKLLYPGYDPTFHYVASFGVALTSLLILPLADYIRRKLRRVSAPVVDVGASAFGLGGIGLTLAGLIVSHPARGTALFPHLHEILARMAAFALGAGMLLLWACAARGYLVSLTRQDLVWNRPSWACPADRRSKGYCRLGRKVKEGPARADSETRAGPWLPTARTKNRRTASANSCPCRTRHISVREQYRHVGASVPLPAVAV
jgi:Protein of unknown function (DUF998)